MLCTGLAELRVSLAPQMCGPDERKTIIVVFTDAPHSLGPLDPLGPLKYLTSRRACISNDTISYYRSTRM